jgi:hypothetical protein
MPWWNLLADLLGRARRATPDEFTDAQIEELLR